LTLVATILGSSLAFLDAFIVTNALPTIRERLHFGFAGQQWVVLAYSLALVALYLIAGAVGDRLGRRRIFLWAIVAFAVTSAGAALAQDVNQLIAARAGQVSKSFERKPRLAPSHLFGGAIAMRPIVRGFCTVFLIAVSSGVFVGTTSASWYWPWGSDETPKQATPLAYHH